MTDWESRRVEELLGRIEERLEQQTKLLKQLGSVEFQSYLLLKQLVQSQAAPTYPATTAISIRLS